MNKLSIFFTLVLLVAQPLFANTNSDLTYDPNNNPYGQFGGGDAGYNASLYQQPEPAKTSCEDNNWDGPCICERQRVKIELVKTQGQTLNQFSWNKIQSKQIVIIGDAHAISNPENISELIVRSRSASGKQCLFLEMPSSYSSDQFIQLLDTKTGEAETDKFRRYYSKFTKSALAIGFKIFSVDHPENFSDTPPSDFEREIHMAKTIDKLFKENSCEHAVFVVGKAHIASPFTKGETLVDRLTQANLSVVRLNLMNAPSGGRSSAVEMWNGVCLKQTYTPANAVIFENKGIENDLIIPGFYEPLSQMTFKDFDYSVLFPEFQFEQNNN